MLINEKQKLANLLIKTASALDIPDHVYEDETLKYEEVGSWLGEPGSQLEEHEPEIYSQGSFRLGTVVRPVAAYDYDIDLVCRLNLRKESTTQANLKKMVGDRLEEHDEFKKFLSPSCRCWLLDYPLEEGLPSFHMDILPAISNVERPPDGILLTDTKLLRWQKSNPKSYASWFFERMRLILNEKRAALAKAMEASIEQVPEWRVKTPLQIAVQVLKRHRDIHFQNQSDDKPVSIILTTLAARAYRNQADVYDAFADILRDMSQFIENRNGFWWIENPVEPDENFADRWNQYPERRTNFYSWLTKARQDFAAVGQRNTLNEAVATLSSSFGANIMNKVARDLGIQQSTITVQSAAQVPGLGSIAHCEPPQWPTRTTYQAHVNVTVHWRRNGKKLWDYVGKPVPKRIWLKFILSTNAPPPYDIRWQVVNTGQEAMAAGQLRGEFYEGNDSGKTIRWESTAYRGTHWVECFVIKNGVCVASSGRKTIKIR